MLDWLRLGKLKGVKAGRSGGFASAIWKPFWWSPNRPHGCGGVSLVATRHLVDFADAP